MSLVTIVAAEEVHAPMLAEPWVFGVIAICIFIALAFVLWSFRDVANRHSHKAAPDADAHAGAPGASHHGDGHPGHEH